jgi:hypothetical protein
MTREAICWRLPGVAKEQSPTELRGDLGSRGIWFPMTPTRRGASCNLGGLLPKSYESQRS